MTDFRKMLKYEISSKSVQWQPSCVPCGRRKSTDMTKLIIDFFLNVLLTVYLIRIFVNNQLDAQFFFLYLLIPILYMFRTTKCSSSGESIVSIPLLICHSMWVTVWYAGSIQTCKPHGHLHTVTYTRSRIDTIDSPDDEHLVSRNM